MPQITVGTSATQLAVSTNGAIAARNRGAVPIYLGFDNTVTTANGFQLDPSETFAVSRNSTAQQALWAVTASSTARVDVLVGTV